MNKLIFYIIGYYSIKVSGNNLKRFFKMCINKNVTFKKLLLAEEYIYADVSAADYSQLEELCKKTGVHLEILQKKGLPLLLKHLANNLYYVFLSIFIMLIFNYFNTRLISINISGNSYLSEESIINQLNTAGISIYTNITETDCSAIEIMLIENNSYIKWCSVYTRGNILYILIDEELTVNNVDTEISGYYSNVYGTVKNIYVRNGIATVKVGDEVKPGDMLISGDIPITNTYDEVLETRTVIPDGDVIIEFVSEIHEVQPLTTTKRIYTNSKKGYEFSIFGHKLFSYLPSISGETCDIITENVNLSVTDFSLPATLTTKQVREYNIQNITITSETAEQLLNERYEKTRKSYIDAGYTILVENPTFTETEDCLLMDISLQVQGPAYNCQ